MKSKTTIWHLSSKYVFLLQKKKNIILYKSKITMATDQETEFSIALKKKKKNNSR